MKWWCVGVALAGMAVCATAFVLLAPKAREAFAMLSAQDDPADLAGLRVAALLRDNPSALEQNIEAALAADDPDLANSFVALAKQQNIALADELLRRVGDATAAQRSTAHVARQFASGLLTGNADDAASLSGTMAGDLIVLGDVRDAVREGKHLAMGEDTDRLVLGLATAGLAVTAATYVSLGGLVPVRTGLTLVKDARKIGRLGEGLSAWAGRSARDMVDAPMLQNAVVSGSVLRPGQTVAAIRAAFRAENAGALFRLAKDVARVGDRAGVRAAQDTLRIAEGPEDVARAARLAGAKGLEMRAMIKLLGRGALLLAAGAFDLSLWVFGALLALFGLLSSIKAATERLTLSYLAHRKARRRRQQVAAAPGLAMAGAGG